MDQARRVSAKNQFFHSSRDEIEFQLSQASMDELPLSSLTLNLTHRNDIKRFFFYP
jgi:hypothetical protein